MAEIGGIKELDHVVEEIDVVKLLQRRSIISLIGNVQKSSLILEKVFKVLRSNGVNVQMISEEWHWHGQQKQLSRVTLMLRSVAYISEQLSAPANRVAVINL